MKVLIEPFSCLLKHKGLVWSMAKRDIAARYKGSVMGILWSFLNPLLMLCIYTFVFKYVFKSKWGMDPNEQTDFATILFAGLILHVWLAEVLSRSVGLMSAHTNFVKKMRFPLEILPWVVVISSGVQFLMGLVVLIAFMLVNGISFQWHILLMPTVLIPFSLLLIGLSWVLAALGVFLKDLEQFIQSLVTILLFTSTIFFSLDNAPDMLKPVLKLNPLTIPVESFRSNVIFGSFAEWSALLGFSVFSFCLSVCGYYLFKKLCPVFSDVL